LENAWIKLTAQNGTPTWVNLNRFSEITRHERKPGDAVTIMYTGEGGEEFFQTTVKETPEEILALANAGAGDEAATPSPAWTFHRTHH
jgi:hypothetical protein